MAGQTGVIRLPAGSRVADYEVEQFLRAGPRTAVYRARQAQLGRAVALHVAEDAPGSAPAAQFLADARRLAAVSEAHLVPVYETGSADGLAFAATGVPDGRPLADLLA